MPKRLCAPTQHAYDSFLKTKQVTYEKGNKEYMIMSTTAIMCSQCGDIIYPQYPDKMGIKELERIAELIDKREKAKSRKRK